MPHRDQLRLPGVTSTSITYVEGFPMYVYIEIPLLNDWKARPKLY